MAWRGADEPPRELSERPRLPGLFSAVRALLSRAQRRGNRGGPSYPHRRLQGAGKGGVGWGWGVGSGGGGGGWGGVFGAGPRTLNPKDGAPTPVAAAPLRTEQAPPRRAPAAKSFARPTVGLSACDAQQLYTASSPLGCACWTASVGKLVLLAVKALPHHTTARLTRDAALGAHVYAAARGREGEAADVGLAVLAAHVENLHRPKGEGCVCGVCVGWGGGRGAGGTCNPLIAQTGAPRSRNRVTVQASPLAAGLARPVAGSPLVAQQHAALPGKVVCQLRLIVTLHGGRSRLGLSSKQVRGCGCKAVLAGLHLVDGVGRQARAKQTADPPRAARPSCASRMAVQLAGGPWGPAPALHPPAGSWWRRCGRAGAPGRGRMPAPPPPPASKTGKHHTLNQLSFAELCLWQHPWQGGKAQ